VLDVMFRTGLFEGISQKYIFANADMALAAICEWLGEEGKEAPFNPASKFLSK
jgi:hypothetical protein